MVFSRKQCTCLNTLFFTRKHAQTMCICYTRVFMASYRPLVLGLNVLPLICLLWVLLPLILIHLYSFNRWIFPYLLLYVDDIIVTGLDISYISLLKNLLTLEFKISHLGPLKYFLGLEIHSSTNAIFVNQSKYLNDLHRPGMTSAKSYATVTPMSTSLDLYTTAPLLMIHSYTTTLLVPYNILHLLASISLSL